MDVRPNSPSRDLVALVESHGVRNLLESNDTPTDDARRHLEASRATGRAHFASLSETIDSLTIQLAIMKADAVQVSKGLTVLDTVLNPVRMVPHEIIGRICELAVEDLPEVTLEYLQSPEVVDSLSMRHPSWTLSHVCRQWRHAIQNYPPCWTNVVLSFDRPAQSIKLALLLMEVMKHVRSFPLSFSLHSRNPISPHCIPLILQTCSRWRHACLSLIVSEFLVLAEMKHALVGLKTLAIDMHDLARYAFPLRIDTFDEVAQLDQLTARRHVGSLPIVLPGLSSRVRHFVHEGDWVSTDATGACRFLCASVLLESASLALSPEIIPMLPHLPPESAGVRRLTLREGHGYPSFTFPTFLQGITLPNLTELTLDTISFRAMSDDQFAFGIGSSVHTLNLVVDDFLNRDSTALATVLKYTTSLKHLAVHIRNTGNIEAVFSFAGSVLEDRPIESFTFSSDDSLDIWQTFDTGGVVRTNSSLWRRGVLKSVSMRPLNDVQDGAATALKGLTQSGLALDVRGVDGRSLLDEW
ncbi:hypothetical protein BDZ89DRAFT_1070149 [Hymenopellis radicata]|nr:hypothetical protein BDZ89DRAFT_1070149 [Hymenopellis radicata]